MAEEKTPVEWRMIGETIPGASHARAGIPNQDSILFVRQSSRALPVTVSVADGHGSAKCFRSDLGSRFAVKEAVRIVGDFLDEKRGQFDLAEIESRGKTDLPREFVENWKKAVECHLKNNPFTDEEFARLEEKSGAGGRDLIEENPLLAYGTTSLTVALEEDFIIYMQLGDGDILNISPEGEVKKPLPEDERLLANETTSLCLPGAEKDFRFFVQKISPEENPAMIFLSTDGYLNSFSSEAGFFQAATDILEMLRAEQGFTDVNDNLKLWLEEATRLGSGDDSTVALLYRPDSLKITDKKAQSEKVETILSNAPPSVETSPAIVALPESETFTPKDLEDVTVTITIKKDKNKNPKTASAAPDEAESAPLPVEIPFKE